MAIRYVHVLKLARPSKRSMLRTMAIIASWVASAAVGVVTGDPPAHGVDPVVVELQQPLECQAVTPLRGQHERAVVGRRADPPDPNRVLESGPWCRAPTIVVVRGAGPVTAQDGWKAISEILPRKRLRVQVVSGPSSWNTTAT